MQRLPISLLVSWLLVGATTLPLAVVAQSPRPAFFTTPYMVDIRASHASIDDRGVRNVALWGPTLNGGFGSWRDGNAQDSTYGGGIFRPFGNDRDLVLEFNHVNDNGISQSEAKGQYIGKNGVGFGFGYVERFAKNRDLYFTKFIYQKKHQDWDVYLSPQWQRNPDKNDLGGYFALSNDVVFVSAGTDGEQWRGLFSVLAKRSKTALLHPVGEVLYVDNSLGDQNGVKFFFINGSLGFDGGFMSPQSRLGRALGPNGINFGGTSSFLSQSWNRTADVWEIGQLVNVRIIKAEFPNGQEFKSIETVFFPLQFVRGSNWAKGFFLGFQNRDYKFESGTFQSEKTGMIGYKRQLGQALIATRLSRNFELSSNELVFSFKYHFLRN